MTRALLVVTLLIALPCAASAQARRPAPPPAAPDRLTIKGFGHAGFTVFQASKSFKAIFGQANGPLFGGGVEVGFPNHFFVSVAASRFRRTGHRVFVFEGQVFELNVPATVTITPLELTGGYRFGSSGLRPYLGGGIGWHKYEETSGNSTDADDLHSTHVGYHGLGGIELPIGKWLATAIEGQYSSVPNALGENPSAVSSVYNEHNLGGFTVRAKLIFGR